MKIPYKDDVADIVGFGGLIGLAVTLLSAVVVGVSSDPLGFSQVLALDVAFIMAAMFIRRTGEEKCKSK
jgi:hypothetical protein